MNTVFSLKNIGLLLGPLSCAIMLLYGPEWGDAGVQRVLAAALWMIVWWVTEAVSISVTSLLPLVLFPLLGINEFGKVATNYGSSIIFLFLGGFVLALAMEKVNLHRRIALNILTYTGSSPQGILLGLMVSTGFLSMWISNTATTLVILPIALTIVGYISEMNASIDGKKFKGFKIACMLGIAYAANIGGTATIIGTPPNVVLIGYMEEQLGVEVEFMQWLYIALPFTLALFTATFLALKFFFLQGLKGVDFSTQIIREEIEKIGRISKDEIAVICCFAFTIFLWVFRIQFNALTGLKMTNAHIAMTGALLTFMLPSWRRRGRKIIEWEDTKNLQWGILILFGGGLALAGALADAGIVKLIGDYVSGQQYSPEEAVPMVASITLLMTEFMSNVALVSIFSPMLNGITTGLGVEFMTMGVPVALASSCAFMLPMSTPPNAIVYSSGFLKVIDMLKVGVLLNLVAIALLALMGRFWMIFFI